MLKKISKTFSGLMILALLLPVGCSSGSKSATGMIVGNVTLKSGSDYKNILVYIAGYPYTVYTDNSGNYTLNNIPVSSYVLNAVKTGYKSASQKITVSAGRTVKALPMVLDLLATSFSASAPLTTVEDQPFGITVSAMLNNSILPTYNGIVNITSSWGNITPTVISGFSSGKKTFTAWLNREGPASISFSDTSAPQATSSIGINVLPIPWRINTPPVINIGSGWENTHVAYPSVAKVSGTYYMLYSGYNGTAWQVGIATSTNGVTWTKSAYNPVISIGSSTSFYSADVSGTTVLYDNNNFRVWFSGYDGQYTRIGIATSGKGIAWTVYSSPVVNTGSTGTWDNTAVAFPSVIKDGSEYKMWYSGYDGTTWRIGYATSANGTTWTKYPSNSSEVPVLDVSSGFDSAGVIASSVIKDGNIYKMYYTGISNNGNYSIGYATSADGINWIKSISNPMLSYGSGTISPDLLFSDMHLYFSYFDGTNWKIALATYP